MRKAVEKNYRGRLSGYSETLLIISIDAARRLKCVRDERGGGRRKLQKIERFWALSKELERGGRHRGCRLKWSEAISDELPENRKQDVAAISEFSYTGSGLAGLEVYQTKRSTHNEGFEIQEWGGGGVL